MLGWMKTQRWNFWSLLQTLIKDALREDDEKPPTKKGKTIGKEKRMAKGERWGKKGSPQTYPRLDCVEQLLKESINV